MTLAYSCGAVMLVAACRLTTYQFYQRNVRCYDICGSSLGGLCIDFNIRLKEMEQANWQDSLC